MYPYSVTKAIMVCAVGVGLCSFPCSSENIVFPRVRAGLTDASGIVDVTQSPYLADKTGATDVTAKLQQAFDDHQLLATIYLPNGTYLVSNTVAMTPPCASSTGSGCIAGPILQGQSQAGTIIKLASGIFTNPGSPEPVLFSGDGVAQEFQRGIHNLTVEVGPNNAGANGIRWFSNNQGLMSDVSVVSVDGGANIGVDLGGAEQGPCAMRDIRIKGFGIGVESNALNSVTCLNLTIEDSRQYGVFNPNAPLYIENLVCSNAPVAVSNRGAMTLISAQLTGGSSSEAAVENSGILYAQGVSAQGYGRALTSSGEPAPTGLVVEEYVSRQAVSLFNSPSRSIGLPYKPMPEVEWEQDMAKWGNTWVAAGGMGSALKSDAEALQGLIDSSSLTTICVPAGRAPQIDEDVFVRGTIKRIVGTGARFQGSGRLVVTGGTQPVIKIERIYGIPIVVQSPKTVIIESFLGGGISSTGSGDLFICDIVGHTAINAPNQRIWAWQFNAESSNPVPKLAVHDVYSMRIVGWKDEPTGQSIEVTKGVVELLGFMFYASWSTAGQTMFVLRDEAQFSAACVTQTSFNGNAFQNLVSETRSGDTRTLTASSNGSSDMPLYTGYDASRIPSDALPVRRATPMSKGFPDLQLRSGINGRVMISLSGRTRPARADVFTSSGCRAASAVLQSDGCTVNALPAGIYRAIISGEGFRVSRSFAVLR